MNASQFSDAQKAFILKQGDEGVVAEICRRDQPGDLFQLEEKIRGHAAPEIKKLKQLEDENARLRKIVTDPTPDRERLQDVVRRKL